MIRVRATFMRDGSLEAYEGRQGAGKRDRSGLARGYEQLGRRSRRRELRLGKKNRCVVRRIEAAERWVWCLR
jgi:hypothetical protein